MSIVAVIGRQIFTISLRTRATVVQAPNLLVAGFAPNVSLSPEVEPSVRSK
ncbi:hypothetical protein CBM2633_A110054 [Cupriavidus taiwanensis]|nr:hypothetical protein CBM2633_A110054 [Cupriavidus taiwanensis]